MQDLTECIELEKRFKEAQLEDEELGENVLLADGTPLNYSFKAACLVEFGIIDALEFARDPKIVNRLWPKMSKNYSLTWDKETIKIPSDFKEQHPEALLFPEGTPLEDIFGALVKNIIRPHVPHLNMFIDFNLDILIGRHIEFRRRQDKKLLIRISFPLDDLMSVEILDIPAMKKATKTIKDMLYDIERRYMTVYRNVIWR